MTAALECLRAREWQDRYAFHPQCSACGGIKPGESREVIYKPRGHKAGCRLATAITEVGGLVVWADFWQGQVPANEYDGMTMDEAMDRIMLGYLDSLQETAT